MRYRILERTGSMNGVVYYVVQKRGLFFWRNLWPDWEWTEDGFTSWDRTFNDIQSAKRALKDHLHEIKKDRIVYECEVK